MNESYQSDFGERGGLRDGKYDSWLELSDATEAEDCGVDEAGAKEAYQELHRWWNRMKTLLQQKRPVRCYQCLSDFQEIS